MSFNKLFFFPVLAIYPGNIKKYFPECPNVFGFQLWNYEYMGHVYVSNGQVKAKAKGRLFDMHFILSSIMKPRKSAGKPSAGAKKTSQYRVLAVYGIYKNLYESC